MNLYEIAEQCNCWLEDTGNLVTDDIDLKAFADLVRADEREACIRVCMEANVQAMDFTGGTYVGGYFANAIKQRGETK